MLHHLADALVASALVRHSAAGRLLRTTFALGDRSITQLGLAINALTIVLIRGAVAVIVRNFSRAAGSNCSTSIVLASTSSVMFEPSSARPTGRVGKRKIAEIDHRPLKHVAAFIRHDAQPAAAMEECQPMGAGVLVCSAFAQARDLALAHEVHQPLRRDPEGLGDDRCVDLNGAVFNLE
jgi:hypothetical protein